ncbi:MAG: hypothetical protein J6Y80_06375, partial [Victivallales bacterium]|nr:hypothetical protein [Victivallales bacterium]
MTKRFPARLALFACILLTFMATPNPTIAQTGDLTIVKLPAAWKLQLAWQLPRPDATLKGLINTAKTAMDLLALPQTSKSGWSDYVAGQGYGWERQGFANPCGLGVLRQAIRLPEELARRSHLYLVLPGVDEDCWVYLNGELVFEQSQKTTGLTPDDLWNYPLVCEITGKIASDAETLLALGILNRAGMGGLYTDAFLVGADRELTAGEAVTSLPEDNPYGYSVAFMRKFGPADKTGKLKEAILDSWTPYRKSVLEKRAGYEVTVMRYGDHLQQEIYLSVPRSRPNGPCPVVVWYHG